jgi:hypothetical protein
LGASTVEDGPPLVVVPSIGLDSPVREAWHQNIGGAFGEDGEGSAGIIGVSGIGVEAEHAGVWSMVSLVSVSPVKT